ncbi:MAG: hypothetical protein KF809_12505 [Chloroflexi bacterium]|nr:hypothetical protein [Chloroflexota bacterium]
MEDRPTWASLPPGARAFRIAHGGWAVVSLLALARIWGHARAGGRIDRPTGLSIAWLALEGGALVVGRGDCPMGPLQARLGDPVPLFRLVLPPRAAKAAIPVLTVVAVAGIAGALGRHLRAGRPGATWSASGGPVTVDPSPRSEPGDASEASTMRPRHASLRVGSDGPPTCGHRPA